MAGGRPGGPSLVHPDGGPKTGLSRHDSAGSATNQRDSVRTAWDGDVSEKPMVKPGSICFDRVDGRATLVGKAWRSAITGEVHLGRVGRPRDFSFVDLLDRDQLFGSLDELLQDRFLFRPVPFTYRTWVYHYMYVTCAVVGNASENGTMQYVLESLCVDAPVMAGRWSPLMIFAPSSLALCLTSDLLLVLIGMAVNLTLFVFAFATNTPTLYRFGRLATCPLRLAFGVFLLVRSAVSSIGFVGILLSLAGVCLDVALGDCKMLWDYRYTCQYEVLRILPNRVLVCRRNGASHLEDAFGGRGEVPEMISKVGHWDSTMHLVTEVLGLLVELRPVTEQDLQSAFETYSVGGQRPKYVGIDIFAGEPPWDNDTVSFIPDASASCRESPTSRADCRSDGLQDEQPDVSNTLL